MVGKKNLSTDERNLVVQFLLVDSTPGKPRYGRMIEAETKFNLSKSTVQRLWKFAAKQQALGQLIHVVLGKKKNRKGHNMIEPDLEKLKSLPLTVRTSYRKMEIEMKVSRSTLSRWARANIIRAHTSSLKPSLTADNKFLRMRFSLESLELDRVMNSLKFSSMHNIVHIDEKWFYITKGCRRYYLAPDEEEPYRAYQSKKFIGKIMFMCAVAWPILRDDGSVEFDGKIGIFPFTHQVEACRKSKKRVKGTFETKAVDSITREVIKSTIITKVLPAIRAKWPHSANKHIFIQQDNAKPHITNSNKEFRAAATQDGFQIELVQQPPNSPDTNINDLGFFNAIQSIQQQRVCKSVDDLVDAVVEAFHQLAPTTLNKVFLTLQGCLTEILKVQGHNKNKIPHMGKDRMIMEGTLPITLTIPMNLVRDNMQYLIENGQIKGIEHLVHKLGIQQLTGI